MKLSLVYLSVLAASVSAAAIPASDNLAVRENHAPVVVLENPMPRDDHATRATIKVSFARSMRRSASSSRRFRSCSASARVRRLSANSASLRS